MTHVSLVLVLVVLADGFFQDVTDAKDGFGNSLEVDFSHFDFQDVDLGDSSGDIVIVFLVLFDDRPVDFISCLEYSFDVFFDIFDDSLDFVFEFGNGVVDQPHRTFDFDSLVEDVVVALVLLQLQRLIDKFKVLVHFLDLLPIELLGVY